MNLSHPSAFASILLIAFELASGTVVWMWQTEWGQSSTVFFGVRVPEHFEDSFDAMPIRIRYESTVKLIPWILVAVYAALAYFLPSLRVPANRAVLYGVGLIQAIAVRAIFWRARNETLPFAAAAETTRSASLTELRAPSRTWRMLYWLAVLVPLVLVGCAIAFIWSHWLALRLPVDSNLRFPLTVDSPTIAWKRSELLGSLRWAIDAVLLNLAAIVVACAFNFRSRISEWGEQEGERRSYRKQLMVFALFVQWATTIGTMLTFFNVVALASPVVKAHMILYMVLALLVPTICVYGVGLWLLMRLYDNRPPGFASKADDRHWRLGLYYFNFGDSAAIVPTRFGVGETLNLAHPIAWTLIALSGAGMIVRLIVPRSFTGLVRVQAADGGISEEDRSTFLLEKTSLESGDFHASERLLRLARDRYDADLWSSVAFVLAQYHIKPQSGYRWAASAVAMAESNTNRLDLAHPTPEARSDMLHLAKLWSNLGFVCLQRRQPDTDCAQRYLLAAEALDPHPSYAELLAKAQQQHSGTGDENGAQAIFIGKDIQLKEPGYTGRVTPLDIVLTSRRGATVSATGEGVDPIDPQEIADAVRFPWPDGSRVRVLVRSNVSCPLGGSWCTLTILRPE